MLNEKKVKRSSFWQNWSIAIVSIFAFAFVITLWCMTYYTLEKDEDRGVFGDMFGGVNALFSGLAFAGIIITILLQRKDLGLQQDALEETRVELKRTADAQTNQNQTLLNQQYQTTFFNLLSNHTSHIDSIHFNRPNGVGYDGLANFTSSLQNNLQVYTLALKRRRFHNAGDTQLNPLYQLQDIPHFFDSLFGNIETILRIIDELLKDSLYHEILYNHLTTLEKYLIGIYCDCINDSYSRRLALYHFRFNRYYDNQQFKYNLGPGTYFPAVTITRDTRQVQLIVDEIDPNGWLFDFQITLLRNAFSDELILKKIKVTGYNSVIHNAWVPLFNQEVDDSENADIIILTLGTKIHLTPYIFKKFADAQLPYITLKFEFIFIYHHIEYRVEYTIGVVRNKLANQSDFSMKDTLFFSIDR